MKQFILYHAKRYPCMEAQDYIKLLYQSEFGGSHFVADEAKALELLRAECAALPAHTAHDDNPFEEVGCGMCRMYLSRALLQKVSVQTLNRLAVLSASAKRGSMLHLKQKLAVLQDCIHSGEVPLEADTFAAYLAQYTEQGYPSVHHSEAYRAAYAPAYRLVTTRIASFFPVICLIEALLRTRKKRIVLALEGPAGGGKSTLAAFLERLYDCNVFHMDDFFLPPDLRTEERLAEIGGNVDYARFSHEVAAKLRRGTPFVYRRFDCASGTMRGAVYVTPKRLNIVEGCYSMHPQLNRLYSGRVFVDVTPAMQRRRITARSTPAIAARYFSTWIPMEQAYYKATDARARCDVAVFLPRS